MDKERYIERLKMASKKSRIPNMVGKVSIRQIANKVKSKVGANDIAKRHSPSKTKAKKTKRSSQPDLSKLKTFDSILREIEAGKKLRSMIITERSVKRSLPHYEENTFEKEQREKDQKERDLLRSKLMNYAKVLRPKYAYRIYNQVEFDNLENMRENLRRIEAEIKTNPNILNNLQVSVLGDTKAKEKSAEQEAELEHLREELAKAQKFIKQRDTEFQEVMKKAEAELKQVHDREVEQFQIQLDRWKAEHGRLQSDYKKLQEELQTKLQEYSININERERTITELQRKIVEIDEECKLILADASRKESSGSEQKMQELVDKVKELQGVIHNQELALAHFRSVAMVYQKEIQIIEQAKREHKEKEQEGAKAKMLPSPPKTPRTPKVKQEEAAAEEEEEEEEEEERPSAPSPRSAQIAQELNPVFQKLVKNVNKYHFNSHANRITANAMLFDQYEQLVREKRVPKPAQAKALIDQVTSSVDSQFPDRHGFFKQPLTERQDQFYKANMLSQITGTPINVPKEQERVGISDYTWSSLGANDEERKKKLDEMLSHAGPFGEGFAVGLHHGLKHLKKYGGKKVHDKLVKVLIFRK